MFQLHVVVSLDRGTIYIGASVHFLEGENDDHIMFPFKGTLTLSLTNQRMDRGHQEKSLHLNPQFCQRENRGMLHDSDSFLSMLPRCSWKGNSSILPCYVVDGRLYIKLSCVEFDRDTCQVVCMCNVLFHTGCIWVNPCTVPLFKLIS